jgi:hypothetical protein
VPAAPAVAAIQTAMPAVPAGATAPKATRIATSAPSAVTTAATQRQGATASRGRGLGTHRGPTLAPLAASTSTATPTPASRRAGAALCRVLRILGVWIPTSQGSCPHRPVTRIRREWWVALPHPAHRSTAWGGPYARRVSHETPPPADARYPQLPPSSGRDKHKPGGTDGCHIPGPRTVIAMTNQTRRWPRHPYQVVRRVLEGGVAMRLPILGTGGTGRLGRVNAAAVETAGGGPPAMNHGEARRRLSQGRNSLDGMSVDMGGRHDEPVSDGVGCGSWGLS